MREYKNGQGRQLDKLIFAIFGYFSGSEDRWFFEICFGLTSIFYLVTMCPISWLEEQQSILIAFHNTNEKTIFITYYSPTSPSSDSGRYN